MTKSACILAIVITPALLAFSAAAEDAQVSHVSPDHVYVDQGSAAGIAPGDTLVVMRAGNPVARLVVEFAAERSASCTILAGTEGEGVPAPGPVRAGDRVTVTGRSAPSGAARPSAPPPLPRRERPFPPESGTPAPGATRGPRTWGAAGVDYERMSGSSSRSSSSRSTLRLRLTVLGLADHYALNVHARANRDDRAGASIPGLPASEWRDQVYALSLRRDPAGGRFGMELGRLSPPVADAGGAMDGLVLRATVGDGWDLGAFGGTSPTWGFVNAGPRARRAGAFATLRGTAADGMRFFAAAAVVGQYASGTIDRESISMRGSLASGRAWSFSPGAVIDLNRRWRRTAAGSALSLSRLDLTTSFDPPGPLSLRASYDRDGRPWTLDDQTTPDSLFDGSARESWRTGVSAHSVRWAVSAAGGTRRGSASGSRAWFWSGDLRRASAFGRSTSVALRASGYRGSESRGVNPSVEVRRDPVAEGGPRLGLGAGLYRYSAPGLAGTQSDSWIRLDAGVTLSHAYRLDAEYQHASGGVLPAHTARGAFERRF